MRTLLTHSRRRGTVLVYQAVAMIAMLAFASLGVDFGHVQMVKMQLRCAADAAALAATDALLAGNTNPAAVAVSSAAENSADGSPVVLSSSEVASGHWNKATATFITGGTPLDAVSIIASRTQVKGNSVKLQFAGVIGQANCDTSVSAIGHVNVQVPPHAFAAASSFNSMGLLTMDSYPTSGAGSIASNGTLSLNVLGLTGLTYINGDARPGPGYSIYKPPLGITTITGSTTSMNQTISYPPVDASDYATHNDNASLPGSMIDSNNNLTSILGGEIPAGTYYLNNLTVLAGIALKLNGPVTFYVTGNTTLAANIQTYSSDPANLKIRVAGSGAVTMAANITQYMDLYAPQSTINIAAGGCYYGALAGNAVNILGTSFLHFDTALDQTVPPKVELVK